MRVCRRVIALVLSGIGLFGCQQIDGECWPVSEDGAGDGVGGGPIVPGAGGFGAVPLDPQGAGDSPPPECMQIGSYSSALFKFAVVIPDDGEGEGGGWQKATAPVVKFMDGRQDPPVAWTCSVWVGMPIRTAKHGHVSPQRAADIAADVLTLGAGRTMHKRTSWQPTAFCLALGDEMQAIFKSQYKGLGATTGAKR